MKYRSSRGIGTFGFIIMLALLGFIAYIGIQLAPIYIEHFGFKKILTSDLMRTTIKNAPNLAQATIDMRSQIAKDFQVNDMTNIPLNNIHLTQNAGGAYQIDANYDVRKHIMGNVDVVVTFEDHEIIL